MLKLLAGLLLWSLPLTAALAADRAPPCTGTLVYFGTSAGEGGPGVLGARLDEQTGRLCALGSMAAANHSSWMTKHPEKPVLYVTRQASGVQDHSVFAFSVDPRSGALTLINSTSTGGAGPTHLSVDASSGTLFAAHWNSGHVSAVPIRDDGGLGAPTSVQASAHPTGSRTHAVRRVPGAPFVLATEFGHHQVLVYRFDSGSRSLTPSEPAFTATPPGSGPRHFAFHPNGRYVYLLNELSSEVVVYGWDAASGVLQAQQTTLTLGPGYDGKKHAAAIVISPDGRHLYLSNRGEDVIVAYAVDASTGRLTEADRIASGGQSPRDFALAPSGRWVVVANQESSTVNVLARDPQTGRLSATTHALSTRSPVVVTFVPGN